MKKKLLGFFVAVGCIFCTLFGFSGCSKVATNATGTAAGKVQEYEFPKDGILTKDVFEALKGTVNTSIYKGKADDTTYVWTFNGADITKPMDFNITVAMNNDDAASVQKATGAAQVQGFKFADNEDVPGKYNLRINLNSLWDCESIDLYHLDGNNLGKIGAVYKDNANGFTQVNFGLTVASGQFYLVSSTQVADADTMLGTDDVILTDEEARSLKQQMVQNDENYTGATDQYGVQLDNIPQGKKYPADEISIDYDIVHHCTISINCANIWNSKYNGKLDPAKAPYQPGNGVILPSTRVEFYEGETVFEVLDRVCKEKGIHLEYSYTPLYGSYYIEGINNLYEFDCGELSGWMYNVDGWYPNYGCSRYVLTEGENIEWNYTCDLGRDLEGGSIY